jgi:signal transduction histidine kinase/ActR/RegA family two-component response regulator
VSRRFAILLGLLALLPALDAAEPVPVTLHLKYFHQFQFAGYYAAESKGYYRDEGLAVDIREPEPGQPFPPTLGDGDMAILNTSFPERWARGEDLFLVAIIFQHNPFTVLVHQDSPLHTLADLATVPHERLVAPVGFIPESELWSGLTRLGIDPKTLFNRARQPGDFERFVGGELEVLPAYTTNELPHLRRLGVAVRELPMGTRHNLFFGDSLVCGGDWQRRSPATVEAFRRASLRGWAYALAHPGELVDHILSARPSRWNSNDRQSLLDEATAIAEMVDADTFTLGAISRERLGNLAAHLAESGTAAVVRDDLLFHQQPGTERWFAMLVGILLVIALAFLLLAAFTRRQHRHLAESRAHYRTLVEMAEGYFAFRVLLVGDGFRPELASPSIAAILGHGIEHYQRDATRFLAQMPAFERTGLAAAARRTLLLGRPLRITLAIRHGTTGARRRVLIHARASRTERGLVADGICLDLTAEAQAESERRQMERQLQQALRHESLALLAGGVAHDFNNLLGAIRGNAELIKPAVADEPTMLGRWNRLLMAVDRAAGLVRQILAFTGKAAAEARPLDVEREVRQLIGLLKHSLPAGVTVNEAIEPGLPPVLFDQVQFQQVVLNLVVNAAESYQGRAGEVTVSLIRLAGNRLMLRVSDLGCGMDAATQARMFEPYFTTKVQGHGLGLAAVRGIIAKAGGTMECHSALGKGSTFSVILSSLPGASRPAADHTPVTASPVLAERHVLVVDDDALLRETMSAILRDIGYQVSEASGGHACLDALGRAHGFSAVLLDCRMPDLDGLAVLRRLRGDGNGIPVLLMSGYHQDPDLSPLLALPHTRFIGKPFTGTQLGQALQALLGRGSDDESSTYSPVDEYVRHRGWRPA